MIPRRPRGLGCDNGGKPPARPVAPDDAAPGMKAELQPNAMFRVKRDNDHDMLAHISGKLRKNRIRVLAGDRVSIQMTPYDLATGRLTFRFK